MAGTPGFQRLNTTEVHFLLTLYVPAGQQGVRSTDSLRDPGGRKHDVGATVEHTAARVPVAGNEPTGRGMGSLLPWPDPHTHPGCSVSPASASHLAQLGHAGEHMAYSVSALVSAAAHSQEWI